jgi:hypothetical protein
VETASELFHPPVEHERKQDPGSLVHRLHISGVTVVYERRLFHIEVTCEGELPQEIVRLLMTDLERKLTKLEKIPCTAKKV